MAERRRNELRKSLKNPEKPLEIAGNRTYLTSAQFRTCLWPRAGRWASGQEAGQPPGTRVRSRGMDIPEARIPDRKVRAPNNDRQPEAKPANPALHGGRSLKQRRSGLFWSRWSSKGQHRRGLSFIAGRAGFPQSTVFFGSGRFVRSLRRLHRALDCERLSRLHVASAPLAPGGESRR